MYSLIFSEAFEKSYSKVKDDQIKKPIWKKILQLEEKAPLGKKLKGNLYWSIHINRFRVIYQIENNVMTVIELLERKHDYREL